MLYRQVNSKYMDTNNKYKVVKVGQSSFYAILILYTNLLLKYINGTLKVDFQLDTTSKPKPIAGPDDLLLMLVQYQARNKSVFPTKDNHYDVATVILF